MAEPMVILIPAAFFAGGGVTGWVLGRFAPDIVWKLAAAVCGVAFVAFAVLSQRGGGWEALGHFIAAALMALPALLGVVAGGLLGRRGRR
jgi:hypothetical protein